jgi:hypothetical protein
MTNKLALGLAAALTLAPLTGQAGALDKLEKAAKKASKAVGEEAKYGKIKPSDVNPSLSTIDADKTVNPFLSTAANDGKPAGEIKYVISGKKNYDQFFKDTATLSASVVMTKGLLKITRTELTKIASARGIAEATSAGNLTDVAKAIAAKKGSLKPEDLTMIKSLYLASTGLVDVVKGAPEKATGLKTQGQGFATSAPKDFSTDPLKAPAVIESVTTSIANVATAATEAPALATELIALVGAMKEIGTGGTF